MLNSFLKERVKRFIEESLSALWSLKTSKATHVSVAHVHGEDLISYSVNQIQSWNQVVMFGKFYGWQSYESFPTETNTNISLKVGVSFPIGPERKHKVDFFALFIRSGLLLYTTQPVCSMDTQAIGKANNDTVLFWFKSTATEQVVCSKHRVSKRMTRYNLTFLSFHSFQNQYSFKCWKQCPWYDKSSLRNRKRAFHGCPESRFRR